jgi:beta-N-acetylhexosaminidase
MKSERIILIIFILLMLSGCSFSSKENSTTEITASPTSKVGVTPTQILHPTIFPTAIVAITKASTPTPSPTPIPSNDQHAQDILDSMTLKEKIGQIFFVRCNDATSKADIVKYNFGGYILFASDFEGKTISTVKTAVRRYQKTSRIPMLIGVDEEGGTVNRISKFSAFRSKPFKSPMELYRVGGFDLIVSDTIEKAKLLKSMGININLAPVCDISTNSADFIYKRSFGKDAGETSKYVKTVVTTMNSNQIGCTLKHFPGYGNNVDTHTGIAIDSRSSNTFYNSDFLPFKAGILAGAGSVMVSHNIVNCFDKKHPASLSPAVHEILREDLGFSGVIMTDDLSMDAIKQYSGEEEAAVTAVLAGNDLLVVSDYDVQIPAVIKAVKNKKITEERIDESVLRILKWKLELGIIK